MIIKFSALISLLQSYACQNQCLLEVAVYALSVKSRAMYTGDGANFSYLLRGNVFNIHYNISRS